MKKLPAIIAALVTTGLMALAIVLIGVNALFNPNTVQAANSPNEVVQVSASGDSNTAQVQQLQERIAQYQAREKQYQSQLNEMQQRLQQSNDELNQYTQLVNQLQQMGVIQIDANGNVSVRRFRRDD